MTLSLAQQMPGITHPCTTTGAYGKASVSPSVFAPYQAYFNASLAKVIYKLF